MIITTTQISYQRAYLRVTFVFTVSALSLSTALDLIESTTRLWSNAAKVTIKFVKKQTNQMSGDYISLHWHYIDYSSVMTIFTDEFISILICCLKCAQQQQRKKRNVCFTIFQVKMCQTWHRFDYNVCRWKQISN